MPCGLPSYNKSEMDLWDDFLEMEPGASKYVRPRVESFTFGWRLDFAMDGVSMFVSIDASGTAVIGAYYVCKGVERLASGSGEIADPDFIRQVTQVLDKYFFI